MVAAARASGLEDRPTARSVTQSGAFADNAPTHAYAQLGAPGQQVIHDQTRWRKPSQPTYSAIRKISALEK